MKMSQREIVLGVSTLAVALFGVTALLAKPKIQVWKDLKAERAEVLRKIELDRYLIDQEGDWSNKLTKVSALLETPPAGMGVDGFWLHKMDEIAGEERLDIKNRRAGEEEDHGDIFELPITCDWEGSLDSLVHFLFELQSKGAMLDIQQLMIKPVSGKAGLLRGKFTLYCAYTHEKTGHE